MYILWDEPSRDAVVVDPGMMRDAEREMVTKFIEGQQLKVKHVLLTHLHLDHVTGARWLANETGADVCANSQDAQLGLELPEQVAQFGMQFEVNAPAVSGVGADAKLRLVVKGVTRGETDFTCRCSLNQRVTA